MSLNTTKIGLSVLDRAFGGIYLHRPTLICGRNKSGKSVIATHLAMKTLQSGECVVFFTDKTPEEVMSNADTAQVDLTKAISSGQLLLLPYATMKREGNNRYSPLPFPEALNELKELVRARHVSYVIFDTIVPWVATLPIEEMPDRIERLISEFNEMELTTLLLLPEPASTASRKLAENLRELCPINMEIESLNFGAEFVLRVTKYQGGNRAKLPLEFNLDLIPGVGFEQVSTNDRTSVKNRVIEEEVTATILPNKRKRSYKPFLSQGLSDFSETSNASAPVHGIKATVPQAPIQPAARQPMPQQDIHPVYQAAQSRQPQSVDSSTPNAPAAANAPQPSAAKPSFATVVNFPDFPKADTKQPRAASDNLAQKHTDATGEIKFSSIIR